MRNVLRLWRPLCLAITAFTAILLYLLTALPGLSALSFDVQADYLEHFSVAVSTSRSFKGSKPLVPVTLPARHGKVNFKMKNGSCNWVQLQLSQGGGTFRLFELEAASYFHQSRLMKPAEIVAHFAPVGDDVRIRLQPDHVEIFSPHAGPVLVSKERIFPPARFQAVAVALLFAVMIFWIDSTGRQERADASPSTSQTIPPWHLNSLDGLRGVAAMMVIADHTWGWFSGAGASGVYIFFALSGFLLARPFIQEPVRARSAAYLGRYFRRRFCRILPMYYFYLFVIFALSNRFDLALFHVLFLEGDGHLWAIPQEIIFYLLLPLFLLPLSYLRHMRRELTALLVLAALALWTCYVHTDLVWLLGMQHARLPLMFGVFLSGVFSAVLAEIPFFQGAGGKGSRIPGWLPAALGSGLIVFFVFFSTGRLFHHEIIYSQQCFGLYGFGAGLLVLCVFLDRGHLLERLLNLKPLRLLGMVGLSIYLLHPLVLAMIKNFSLFYFHREIRGALLFTLTLVSCYPLALFTYRRIEQPAASPAGIGEVMRI